MSPRRRPDPILELSVEEITPVIAADWLTQNTHNRKLSDKLVSTYAETMAEGEWRLNGEPIIFDKNGRLQSGQHRLMAVIESNTTITSVVVRGAEPESIYSLESGRRRRMTDVLTLMGETDVANIASTLSWTWRWENDLMDRSGETPVHTHLIRLLSKNPELREEISQGRRVTSALGWSAGLMTALYHQLYKIDSDDCVTFWDHIVTGENLNNDHPAFVFRRWSNRAKLSDRRPTMPTVAAVTIKAWNAYREHRTVRNLSWRPEETFPEAI